MPDNKAEDLTTEDQVKAGEATNDEDEDGDPAVIAATPAEDDDSTGEWTEAELAALSDEERAALTADDEGDDDTTGDDEDAAELAAAEEEKAKADAAKAADDTAADDAKSKAADEDRVGTMLEDVGSYDKLLTGFEDAKVAAFDKWEDGDLSRDEYLAKMKEIDAEARKVAEARAIAVQQEEDVRKSFIAKAGQYFGQYPELASTEVIEGVGKSMKQMFNDHVMAVTGSDRYQHLTHTQMLELAHRQLAIDAELFGIEVATPARKGKAEAKADPKAGKKDDKTPAKPAKKNLPGDNAPKTLANLPASAPVAVSDGKYSAIEARLKDAGPEEYERILSSLSEDEREAFSSMDV